MRAVLACDHRLHFGDDQEEFEALARWGATAQPWPLVLKNLRPADKAILRIAHETGAAVLSGDHFKEFRGQHPWISGTTDRFYDWRMAGTPPVVQIVTRKMLVTGDYTVSAAEQGKEDQKRGLKGDLDEQARTWHYRCVTDSCILHQRFPDRLPDLPEGRHGFLVCSECKQSVERGDRRKPSAFVKLFTDKKIKRFGIEKGDSVVVGRGTRGLANYVLGPADLRAISSSHLRISFDGRQVTATDLGSTNGSVVEAWSVRDCRRRDAIEMRRHEAVALRRNDRLTLAGALNVALSGHRAPIARSASSTPDQGEPRASSDTSYRPAPREGTQG